jgi:hypothetical protein
MHAYQNNFTYTQIHTHTHTHTRAYIRTNVHTQIRARLRFWIFTLDKFLCNFGGNVELLGFSFRYSQLASVYLNSRYVCMYVRMYVRMYIVCMYVAFRHSQLASALDTTNVVKLDTTNVVTLEQYNNTLEQMCG